MNIHWTDEELAALRDGLTYHEFVDRFGDSRSPHAYRLKKASLSRVVETSSESQQAHDAVAQPDIEDLVRQVTEDPTEDKIRQLFRASYTASSIFREINPSLHRIEREFSDDLPVGIAFAGDMHIGADFVDTDRIESDMTTIRDTDGLYAIGMGDYVEGITKDAKAIGALVAAVGAVGNRDIQDERALACLAALDEKLLCMIDGNHDSWLQKVTGANHTASLAKRLDVPYFREAGGSVYLTVGGIRYLIAVKHTYRGNSRLNTSNAQRNAFNDWPEWASCDVICLGHYHFNDLHQQSRRGHYCTYLRSGTWKVHDSYSRDLGYTPEWGIPIAVLYPDNRRVIAFRGDQFNEAIRFLAGERATYQRGVA